MNIQARGNNDNLNHIDDGLLHPLLKKIYSSRGIKTSKDLDKELQDLIPYNNLSNINKLVLRLQKAIYTDEKIIIIGDFDADGATSTALAVKALKEFGANNVDFLVPNRFKFGYGLTPGIVSIAKEMGAQVIVTVDNGISNFDGVELANSFNIDVLITDHHLAPEMLPNAYAIVNPNQEGDLFPSKNLSGVGVIFYVMLALRQLLKSSGWFADGNIPNMAKYLDIVALGTVADVVPLDKNNRILVYQGILRIKNGLACPGIQALIEVSSRIQEQLSTHDLGFFLGPRLNAAGRLDDMSIGIKCLLSLNLDEAKSYALELNNLNIERRKIESSMQEQAYEYLSLQNVLIGNIENNEMPRGLCLFHPDWHQGVIGVLAGRIKEKYHKPVIAFAKTAEDELKGSARSITNINIRDILAIIDMQHPNLIIKFGGHAMAAGLSIHPNNFDLFQKVFYETLYKHCSLEDCAETLWTDGALEPSLLSLEIAQIIRNAGPWGQHFPEPIFHNKFILLTQKIVGEKHLKCVLQHEKNPTPIDAIFFNIDLNIWPNYNIEYVDAVYKLDINSYLGKNKLQLSLVALEPYYR